MHLTKRFRSRIISFGLLFLFSAGICVSEPLSVSVRLTERLLPGEFDSGSYRGASDLPFAEMDAGPVPELSCRSAVLIDDETGAILFVKHGDEVIPPASMTKLVSLHLMYREIEEGRLSIDQEIIVPDFADFRSAPPRSSLMFLQAGQRVRLIDLMRGLALPSGNDAAVLVADLIAGSTPAYVAMMNDEMRRLGFSSIFFEDSSGYSEHNRATALDFARFARFYVDTHPESLKELHSLTSFSYPKTENENGVKSVYGTVTQPNHNSLVGRHPWVDGLKTGYIDESGYNVALTAETGGRRLIAVLMGGPGENSRDGDLHRVIDGTNLLSYGFYRFAVVSPELPELPPFSVIGGKDPSVEVAVPLPDAQLLFAEELGELHCFFEAAAAVAAPVRKGEELGQLYLTAGDRLLASYPVRAAASVEKAGFFEQIFRALFR